MDEYLNYFNNQSYDILGDPKWFYDGMGNSSLVKGEGSGVGTGGSLSGNGIDLSNMHNTETLSLVFTSEIRLKYNG
jgi:hypothetical protein